MLDALRSIQDLIRRATEPPERSAGQGLAEYGLLLTLIAIVAIASLLFLGGQVSGMLEWIGHTL